MKKGVLILGASSPIARAAAQNLAKRGYPLYLAGRDLLDLERIALDLKIRAPVEVRWGYFAAETYEDHPAFMQTVVKEMGGLEGVLAAFGELPDQKRASKDFSFAKKIFEVNFLGACSILTESANILSKQGSGFIIALSSVAGERGRPSNYIYGAAKGGLTIFLQGLRSALFHQGVRVITIKPGFVDTSMTFGMPHLFLVASPQEIGKKIIETLDKKGDTFYLPKFWGLIMFIIRSIPESIFKKLKL